MDSPPPSAHDIRNFLRADDEDDGDTASQRSISLSSPSASPRNSTTSDSFKHSDLLTQLQPALFPSQSFPSSTKSSESKRESTVDTEISSEPDDVSIDHTLGTEESPNSSVAPSVLEEFKGVDLEDTTVMPATYPPTILRSSSSDSSSTTSMARKARPESVLLQPSQGNLILGIALVDFNHLVGPRVEWSKGTVFDDEEVNKMLPFLALPDGAHLSAEDYSYFHLVPSGLNPTTTVFGISCNQQIAASALLVKAPDVTRSTVQKAVVVLASKPLFGPIRDKLGVVTTALFHQRDFSETQILDDFEAGLEPSLRSQLTESALYMGTNLRELVHTFRHRTLILVKALLLQKRIMFYGHPVERLCTYQYSLICLIPGLLQTLDDCGSPPLASRAPTLSRPMSLRTSDSKSMMAYKGMPLDIFGKDAFFQPYLPLQQLDILKETKSWLCGSTNSIVTQQKEIDLLVNTETGTFEFRDPKVERSAGLTAADRKWIDDIVRDVNETWEDEDPTRSSGMQFKGSEDYLRVKFDEYISAALATVRYRDFAAKGDSTALMGGELEYATSVDDFNPLWLSEFKNTNAYEVWERITDPMLFDIIEPRHPCNEKISVVSDIGLRLSEGLQDLKLEQQLAPAREAVQRTFNVGSANFFSAVQGVRERWLAPSPPTPPEKDKISSGTSTPVEVTKADLDSSTASLDSSASSNGGGFGFARPALWKKHASVDSTISVKSTASSSSDQSPPQSQPQSPGQTARWSGLGSFMGRFSRSSSSTMEAPVIPEEKEKDAVPSASSEPLPTPTPPVTPPEIVPTPADVPPSNARSASPTTPKQVKSFAPKPLNLSSSITTIKPTISLESPTSSSKPKSPKSSPTINNKSPVSSISSAKSKFEALSSSSTSGAPVTRSKINIPAAFASSASEPSKIGGTSGPNGHLVCDLERSFQPSSPSTSPTGGRPRSATRSRVEIPSAFGGASSPTMNTSSVPKPSSPNSKTWNVDASPVLPVPAIPAVPSAPASAAPLVREPSTGSSGDDAEDTDVYAGMAL
ncbi:hypothetical protein D9758_011603 [Tetrapyrgos nigripes]|uniref:UDENN domain-containing protein n=1 Tax=Tetrapyrgos nigripes TaxID=182062 RepID=A0A8H5FPZ8_9AGAR|nr:hypothetical protein D9758_011603 [Tetrapyrgos nigripes]